MGPLSLIALLVASGVLGKILDYKDVSRQRETVEKGVESQKRAAAGIQRRKEKAAKETRAELRKQRAASKATVQRAGQERQAKSRKADGGLSSQAATDILLQLMGLNVLMGGAEQPMGGGMGGASPDMSTMMNMPTAAPNMDALSMQMQQGTTSGGPASEAQYMQMLSQMSGGAPPMNPYMMMGQGGM